MYLIVLNNYFLKRKKLVRFPVTIFHSLHVHDHFRPEGRSWSPLTNNFTLKHLNSKQQLLKTVLEPYH